MKKTEHTPLPWTMHSGSVYQDGPNVWPKGEDTGVRIARMDRDNPHTSPCERDANAAFIVKACNTHNRLVEALTVVLNQWDCTTEQTPEDRLIYNKARALLDELK